MFLVTVHDPICTETGDLDAALYGSFLPVPSQDVFSPIDVAEFARDKAPGAVVIKKEPIVINKGRKRIQLRVDNKGDRPVQVCATLLPDVIIYSQILACRLGLIIISLKQMLRWLLTVL